MPIAGGNSEVAALHESIARAIAHAIEQPIEMGVGEVVVRPAVQDFKGGGRFEGSKERDIMDSTCLAALVAGNKRAFSPHDMLKEKVA